MTDPCQHLRLTLKRSGKCEQEFYKCESCRKNFKVEPLILKVSYPEPRAEEERRSTLVIKPGERR